MHGAVVALRLRGRGGLFYIDGHAGFYDGSGGHSGEIADMGLAIATAHNHPLMSNIEGLHMCSLVMAWLGACVRKPRRPFTARPAPAGVASSCST